MSTVQRYLEQVVQLVGPDKVSIEGFVLQHGREFREITEPPPDVKRGRLNDSFGNAARLAFRYPTRFVYCEGYAQKIQPQLHAWVVDEAGSIIETTWPQPGTSYFGIPFQQSFLARQTALTGSFGLLNQPRHPDLLREKIPVALWLHPGHSVEPPVQKKNLLRVSLKRRTAPARKPVAKPQAPRFPLTDPHHAHHVVHLTEPQRQATLVALAHLAYERPGWNQMLARIAGKMDNTLPSGELQLFNAFKVSAETKCKADMTHTPLAATLCHQLATAGRHAFDPTEKIILQHAAEILAQLSGLDLEAPDHP